MDYAYAVRVVQRSDQGQRNANGLFDRELFLAIDTITQRFTLHERHHVEELALCFAAVEERQQVRMLQVRRNADFGEEALLANHGAQLRAQHLERDVALVAEIPREVYHGHSALTDLPLDEIAAGKRAVQLREYVHVTRP